MPEATLQTMREFGFELAPEGKPGLFKAQPASKLTPPANQMNDPRGVVTRGDARDNALNQPSGPKIKSRLKGEWKAP